MKRLLFISALFIFFTSCNSGEKTSADSQNEKPSFKEADNTSNPDYQKGLALVAKNGCLTCHSVMDKINGPAYNEVANKYAGMPDTIVTHLANKIINGGSGVWGEVPMIAHHDISKEDAEAMVKYVLLCKK